MTYNVSSKTLKNPLSNDINNLITIRAPYQKIYVLQSTWPSQKTTKIIDDSMISSLSDFDFDVFLTWMFSEEELRSTSGFFKFL